MKRPTKRGYVYIPKLLKIFSFGAPRPTPAPMGSNLAWRSRPSTPKFTPSVQRVAHAGKNLIIAPPPEYTEIPAYAFRAASGNNTWKTFGGHTSADPLGELTISPSFIDAMSLVPINLRNATRKVLQKKNSNYFLHSFVAGSVEGT